VGGWIRLHRCPAARLSNEGRFSSLEGATGWINSSPLTPEGLAGKVVVVDFCSTRASTGSGHCPVRACAERYADDGLVVIGAHTPEFSFEHDVDNVTEMLAAMQVEFPIALDNRYAVWDAFANHYWPALYFIGADGRIRHHHLAKGTTSGRSK
jgi:hypothetical protein